MPDDVTLNAFKQHRELFEARLLRLINEELMDFQMRMKVAARRVTVVLRNSELPYSMNDSTRPWPAVVDDVIVKFEL